MLVSFFLFSIICVNSKMFIYAEKCQHHISIIIMWLILGYLNTENLNDRYLVPLPVMQLWYCCMGYTCLPIEQFLNNDNLASLIIQVIPFSWFLFGIWIKMTVSLYLFPVFIQAYQKRNQEKGPEKRLAGLEKYSPEQLFFISYTRVTVILSSNIIINPYCKFIYIYIYIIYIYTYIYIYIYNLYIYRSIFWWFNFSSFAPTWMRRVCWMR